MAIEVITREDLNEFRSLLIKDFKDLLNSKPEQTKKWLKSIEVRNLLNISPGTLQNLRINGTLKYKRIGIFFVQNICSINLNTPKFLKSLHDSILRSLNFLITYLCSLKNHDFLNCCKVTGFN